MNTKKILIITALSLLGLCLLCSLAKTTMKKDSNKKNCDKGCAAAVFITIVLLAVSQLLTERVDYYNSPTPTPTPCPTCEWGNGDGACPAYLDGHDGVCAKWDDDELACCPTKNWTNENESAWCSSLPTDHRCAYAAQCLSGSCSGATHIDGTKGTCDPPKYYSCENYPPCPPPSMFSSFTKKCSNGNNGSTGKTCNSQADCDGPEYKCCCVETGTCGIQ